jgi:hypothetical protein
LPLLSLYQESISAVWSGSGSQVVIERVRSGQTESSLETLQHTVRRLRPYTSYRFRLRAGNSEGWGSWSRPSASVLTPAQALPRSWDNGLLLSPEDAAMAEGGAAVLNVEGVLMLAGDGWRGAGQFDADWITGVGNGGRQQRGASASAWGTGKSAQFANASSGERLHQTDDAAPGEIHDGTSGANAAGPTSGTNAAGPYPSRTPYSAAEHGMVVIAAYAYGQSRPTITRFLYTGGPGAQTYVVPTAQWAGNGVQGRQMAAVTIKAWGAGGGAGNDANSTGGGGAFVQSRVAVRSGDSLRVLVGGGGGNHVSGKGAQGGWNGGAAGGSGQHGGGGGGGASSVRLVQRGGGSTSMYETGEVGDDGVLLLVAAGGGGGGTTNYCCAHGGVGGGAATGGAGEAGMSPGAVYTLLEHALRTESAYSSAHEYNHADGTPVDNLRDITAGTQRAEFGVNDVRDSYGLPARHAHLDWGFAPGADYSNLASGGEGGAGWALEGGKGAGAGGAGGTSGAYEYSLTGEEYATSSEHDQAASGAVDVFTRQGEGAQAGEKGVRTALAGLVGVGGKGADGKEGGGGGGGGWFGGGGGGSGVDGAGGGGGSSFVNASALAAGKAADPHAPYRVHDTPDAPAAPVVTETSPFSVTVEWSPPPHRLSAEPAGYALQMAVGASAAGGWVDIHRTGGTSPGGAYSGYGPRGGALGGAVGGSFTQTGLVPAQSYAFRVRALSRRAYSTWSASTVAQTAPMPVNTWRRVRPRRHARQTEGAGLRFADAPTDAAQTTPSARRGHSLSSLYGFVYLFGGSTQGYDCARGLTGSSRCRKLANATNDLWRLDPVTNTWAELTHDLVVPDPSKPVGAGVPPPRERHTAVAIGGRMLVFGGHSRRADTAADVQSTVGPVSPSASGGSSEQAPSFLADLWEMDPGRVLPYEAEWDASEMGPGDGVGPGSTSDGTGGTVGGADGSTRHGVAGDATGRIEEGRMVQVNMDVDVPAGMCIVGMKAHLRVRHACTRQLQIELLGPGPVTSVTASGADGGVSASALHPDRNPESTDYSRAGGDAGATASARRYKPMESGAGSSRRSLDMPTGRARAVPLIRWRDGTSGVSTGHGSCGQVRSQLSLQALIFTTTTLTSVLVHLAHFSPLALFAGPWLLGRSAFGVASLRR